MGQEREQCVQPQKEEVGTRSGLNDCGIWLATRTKGSKMNRARSDGKKNETREQYVFPHRVRYEGHTLLVREFVIFLQVCGPPHDASWHGPFVNSQFQHHKKVHSDESNEQSWYNKNVQREEPCQRRASNDWAAEHQLHSPRSDHWNSTCDRCTDAQSPVGILVKSQHLSGEGHAKRYK